jgi:hypothetical protein
VGEDIGRNHPAGRPAARKKRIEDDAAFACQAARIGRNRAP